MLIQITVFLHLTLIYTLEMTVKDRLKRFMSKFNVNNVELCDLILSNTELPYHVGPAVLGIVDDAYNYFYQQT